MYVPDNSQRGRGRPVKDETGNRYDRWTVLRICTDRPKGQGTYWWCRCECGTERVVQAKSLRDGASRSCGCLRVEEMQTRPSIFTVEAAIAREEKKKRVLSEWETGKYTSERKLGRRLGISGPEVGKILKRAGYKHGEEIREKRKKRNGQLVADWKTNEYSRTELAAKFELSKSQITCILRNAEQAIGPDLWTKRRRNKSIVSLWLEGIYNDVELASALHLSCGEILTVIRKYCESGTPHEVSRNAQIRELWRQGVGSLEIAAKFNISMAAITRITKGVERVRETEARTCVCCDREFEPDSREAKFCSPECSQKHMREHTEERSELIKGLSSYGVLSVDIARVFDLKKAAVVSITSDDKGQQKEVTHYDESRHTLKSKGKSRRVLQRRRY